MNTNPGTETTLFEGYLRGSLSKTEELQLIGWINSSGENYLAFKEYIAANQAGQPSSEDLLQAWHKLRAKIAFHPYPETNKTFTIPNWLKVAAIVIVALFTGFFADRIIQKDYSGAMSEIIVPNGEKARVVLPDGTKVDLNAGTHFKYPSAFPKGSRKVVMTGEAFFDVTKDKTRPFLIETPAFGVKVTGTSFNLQTYRDDRKNSLTLHTGEVLITANGSVYRVQPGEQYVYDVQTGRSEISGTNLQKSILWKEGVIVIDDQTLEEIRKILERRFDVQIRIMNEKYKKIRYTGMFKSHETIERILGLIKETSPVKFNYEFNEAKNVITIK